jgi:hypothetical protein
MRIRTLSFAVAIALAVLQPAAPARAGTSFDFLFNVSHVSNDNQYFLNLMVGHYGYDREALEPTLPRLRYLDNDLPVVLFLAHESDRPVDFIVDLRARGLSWSVVFTRLNVSPSVLFVGIDRDPGPPYGNAWGYWRKHPKGFAYSDNDIAGLVKVQVGTRYAHATAWDLAHERGRGRPVAVIVADKKGRPWKGKSAKGSMHHDGEQGGDHDNGNQHGHDKPHDHGPHD